MIKVEDNFLFKKQACNNLNMKEMFCYKNQSNLAKLYNWGRIENKISPLFLRSD